MCRELPTTTGANRLTVRRRIGKRHSQDFVAGVQFEPFDASVSVPVMGRRGSTICDRICLVGARGWLLIGGDQVVVALRVSAATATINRTVAGAMALSRTRRWDAIAPRK